MSFGYGSIKDTSFGAIKFSGYLSLLNCTASEDTHVNGYLKLLGSKVKKVVVKGGLQMENSEANGSVTTFGKFKATNSAINGVLCIHSPQTVLENTKAQNIIVAQDKDGVYQTIFLKGTSSVTGDIVFESGNGKVMMSHQAILQGKVHGGSTQLVSNEKSSEKDEKKKDVSKL